MYKILILNSLSTCNNKVYNFYKLDTEVEDWTTDNLVTLSEKISELLKIYPISKLYPLKTEDIDIIAKANNLGVVNIDNILPSCDDLSKSVNLKFVLTYPFVSYSFSDVESNRFKNYLESLGFIDVVFDIVNGISFKYTSEVRPPINYLIPQGFFKIINSSTGNINYTNNNKLLSY